MISALVIPVSACSRPSPVVHEDRSVVPHPSAGKTKDSAIVSIMIQLAGSLGIDVIAEGVETGEQAAFLRAAGCPYGQGYYFSRPVQADAIDAMLGNMMTFPAGLSNDMQ